ncbi:MAG: iron-containing alcohol dehydrogenase [Betaproteobacteria bacterium]|nr:iron-containing alcohol dehydrogenase [Betaproteobacteria bacterium]
MAVDLVGTHHWPAQQRVITGVPFADAMMEEVARATAKRVFITTTRSLTDGKIVANATEALGSRIAGKFAAIGAHSPRASVMDCLDAVRAAKPDLLVAIGGGSVIDATKVVLIGYWNGVNVASDLDAFAGIPVDASAWDDDPQRLRMIAIPTTLSAAEFYHLAGVTDTARQIKESFQHPLAVPKTIILDAAATLETPMALLLFTGMRAVDHAVESWCAARTTPMADTTSLHAMRMLATSLRAIHADPTNLAARLEAQVAMWISRISTMGGVPHGASHGLGYLLGVLKGVPHDITSCITLHAVLRWNAMVNAERQREVAKAFGNAGQLGGAAVEQFVRGLGLPSRLSQIGIAATDIPMIAARYDGTGPIKMNPRPVHGPADLIEILSLAA